MAAKLETLPWLVLSGICDYLNDDDSYHPARERRKDLWAFL